MSRPVVVHELPEIGVTLVARWVFNCYVIHDRGDGRPMVVDLGLPSQVPVVRDVLRGLGHELGDLGGALATHGHLDHIGGLAALQAEAEVAVRYPAAMREMAAGRLPLRSPGPKAMAQIIPVLADQPRDLGSWRELAPMMGRAGYDGRSIHLPVVASGWLDDGDRLPGAPGWEVVHAPGHTDDATCLYHAPSRTLVSGDSVVSFDGQAWCNPEYVDARRSAATEARLRSLPVEHLLPGHGRPVSGPDLMGRALSRDDRPPGSGKLRSLWRIVTDDAAGHAH
ncbi:MAG: MBL fold metallo-hydrolase [Acidimicrobiales bacterium]